ncbi:MAG: exonuclease subunit SbcD [Bacteroidales bacterium]|nr:exonuclease subunit SbcD [Bacteroidales bacterium]
MRILHTSDWHLGKRLGPFARIDEQRRVLADVVAVANRCDVDLVLVAGDLWDVYNPSSDAVALLYQTLKELGGGGRRPVVAIAGNHDAPERVEAAEMLAHESGIILCGFPDTQPCLSGSLAGAVVLRSAPGFIELQTSRCPWPVRLLLTPYANEFRLRQYLGIDATVGLREALQDRWKRLSDEYCTPGGVNLLVGHLFMTSGGGDRPEEPLDEARPITTVGGAGEMWASMVPSQIQYVAMGHLHRRIVTAGSPAPVVYPGSILQYSFAEAGQPKSVEVVELEPGVSPVFHPVGLQGVQPLIRHQASSAEAALQWLELAPKDAYIELTVNTPAFLASEMVKAFHSAHPGIVQIVPRNEVVAGNEELGATPLPDPAAEIRTLFSDYFRSRHGANPDEALESLFGEVIGETDEMPLQS